MEEFSVVLSNYDSKSSGLVEEMLVKMNEAKSIFSYSNTKRSYVISVGGYEHSVKVDGNVFICDHIEFGSLDSIKKYLSKKYNHALQIEKNEFYDSTEYPRFKKSRNSEGCYVYELDSETKYLISIVSEGYKCKGEKFYCLDSLIERINHTIHFRDLISKCPDVTNLGKSRYMATLRKKQVIFSVTFQGYEIDGIVYENLFKNYAQDNIEC